MRKTLFIFSFLTFTGFGFACAQDQFEVSCGAGNFVFSTKKVEGFGVLYIINDSMNQKKDTLLVSQTGADVKNCFCNDTMATFYVDDYPSPKIKIFRLSDERWNYANTIPLPPKFPPVGAVRNGKKYEKYEHTLISVDRVVSELIVMVRDEIKRKLVPIENYSVEFRVSPNGKTLIIDKKKLIDE
ncbi:MAG: hypothetical protein ACKVT2_01930 [Saprospiraceae bacterium]